MNQNAKRIGLGYLVAGVVFTALFFLLPLQRNVTVWIAFFFGIISLLLGYILTYYAFSKGDDVKSRIYGIPLFTIGYKYTGTQIVFSLIVFGLSFLVVIPIWIVVVIEVIILGVFLVGMQAGDIARDMVVQVENNMVQETSQWNAIKVLASSICAVIFIICVLSYINKNVIQPKRKYDKAIELIDNHNYEEGYELLKELGTYKDSLDYVTENMYQRAVDAINKGDYKEAQLLFSDIEDYSDAKSYLKKMKEELEYEDALALYEQGNTDLLFEKYESSDNTKIVDLNQKANYEIAIKLCDEKKYEEAIEYLSKCGEYLDAKEKLNEIAYDAGCNWMKRGFLNKASDCFAKVKDDYEDCQKKKELCDEYKKYTGAWMQKSTGVTFKIYVKLDDGFEKALVNYDSSYGIYSFEIAQIDDDVLRYQDRYYSRHASEDCMSDVNLTITWVTEDKSNIKLEVKDVPKYVSLWMPNCYGTLERIETY